MSLEIAVDLWTGGQLFAFSGIDGATDFENGIVARSSFKGSALEIKIPGELRVEFSKDAPLKASFGGDFLILETASGSTKGAFADARHLIFEGPCEVQAAEGKFKTLKKGSKTLVGVASHFNPKLVYESVDALVKVRSAWLAKAKLPASLTRSQRESAIKALSQLKTQVCSPEGMMKRRWTTPDRWPHRRMWLWDSVFHAIALRHVDVEMAREAIEAVFDSQKPDGFIPHMSSPTERSEITQPPVLALGVSLVNESKPDKEWLKSLYPKLKAYLEWDMKNRDKDGNGLLEWFIESSPTCRSGESGADNSPRFDKSESLDAVDFNSFLSLECELMASFAKELGLDADAKLWSSEQARLNALIDERLWSDKDSFYMDYDNCAGKRDDILSFAGFLPLICGAPGKEKAAKLAAHLSNPKTFGTPLPIASIAKSCEAQYSKDMWRGPVWTNINWLVARGLKRYGLDAEAKSLTRKTLDAVEAMRAKYGCFFEFYDDRLEVDPPKLLRKGKNDPNSPYHQVIHDYGWTATLYLDVVMSEAAGKS